MRRRPPSRASAAPGLASASWATSATVRASMLANRSTNTRPERELGSAVHELGLRYRKHVVVNAGRFRVRVDFLFSTSRLAIFLDGCFWHRCLRHRRQVPVRNGEWWSRKLEATARRDRRQRAALKRHGWTVIRIWEHDDPQKAARSIAQRVRQPRVLTR